MRAISSRISQKSLNYSSKPILFFYSIMKEKNTPQPLTAEKGILCITDSDIQQAAISPLCV